MEEGESRHLDNTTVTKPRELHQGFQENEDKVPVPRCLLAQKSVQLHHCLAGFLGEMSPVDHQMPRLGQKRELDLVALLP